MAQVVKSKPASLNVSSGWLGLRYLVIYELRGNKEDMVKGRCCKTRGWTR